MVIDTSALIAIIMNETSAPRLLTTIGQSAVRLVSAATVIEASLVLLGRFGERGELELDTLLRSLISYALATSYGEPLRYVGNDFLYTDVAAAVW